MPRSVTVGVTCTHVTLVLHTYVDDEFHLRLFMPEWVTGSVTVHAVTRHVVEVVKRVVLMCHVTQSNSLETGQCEVRSVCATGSED